jgi:hypothetical protein
MLLEPTRHAAELALTPPVLLRNVVARGALSRRISGVDDRQRHTCLERLVRRHLSQLEESPPGVASTLRAPDLYPVAEAVEVFQGEAAAGVMGALDKGFADPMVLELTEAGLLARELFEVAFGGFGADELEAVTERRVAGADLLDLGAGVMGAVAVGGEVDEAKVDAEESLDGARRRRRDLDGDMEEELALAVDQFRLAPLPLEHLREDGADDRGTEDPLVEGRQAECREAIAEGVTLLWIEADGAERTEATEGFRVLRVAVSDLGDDPDRELRLEAEAGAQLAVVGSMEGETVENLGRESLDGEPGSRFVAATQGGDESSLLLLRRHHLDRRHQFHRSAPSHRPWIVAMLKNVRRLAFLSALKDGLSRLGR